MHETQLNRLKEEYSEWKYDLKDSGGGPEGNQTKTSIGDCSWV